MADKSKVAEARKPSGARDLSVAPEEPRQPHPAARRSTRMLRGPENAACVFWCSAECRRSLCKRLRGDEVIVPSKPGTIYPKPKEAG